jgi:hypothetical protein
LGEKPAEKPAAKPAAKPAEKVEAKEEMVAAAPKEGDTVELPPGNKYATANRVMVYKDGEWQQKVGGEATKVGATAQKMAADKWSGVAQEVAPAAEPAEKAEAAKEPSAKKAGIKTIPNEVQAPIIKRLNKTIQKIFGKKENQIVSLGGKDWKDALEKAKKEENVNYQAVGIYEKIGFEETEEYQKLLKEGKFVENFDLKNIAGKPVVIINPDNMMTGVITTKDGTPIINGNGGINFVSKFGDVWASSDQETAQQLANYINEARELDIKNGGDGVVHILVTKGTLSKSLTSHTGAKGAMSVLESLVDKKLIGLKDFRKALIAVGKKYNIDFDGKEDAKSIHNDIKNKFFGVEDSTFSKRGTFIADIIDYLAENSNSVHENIEKIREALNSKELISEETGKPKKIAFSKGGIVDAIGLLFSDNITKGVPNSHVYATIEVSKPVKVIKEEKGGHESYPYHIKQEDNSRPILNSVSQKSHITDVVNDKNNNPVLKNIPKYKDGKPVLSPKGVHLTESGAGKLGSNQIGMARGFVKASEDLPNKNEVNYMTDSKGEIYGFEQNGNIFLNQDYVSSNPPIHEAGHIWTNWAEQNRPDLYEAGIKKVAKSSYLKDVKSNKFYQEQAAKLPKDQQETYYKKEALAKAIGDNGEKFATENERKNFKDWVMNMWRAVVKEYGIRDLSAEEVSKMNIDEFSRKVAADIFGGKAEAPKAEPAKAEAKEIEYVPKDTETLRKFVEVDKADTKAEKAKSTAGKKKAESRKKEVIKEVELSDRQKQIENEYNAMKEELEKLGIVKSKCK